MNRESFSVSGMSCTGCEESVENALQTVDGVTRVEADHTSETVEVVVDDGVDAAALHTAVEDAGFDVSA